MEREEEKLLEKVERPAQSNALSAIINNKIETDSPKTRENNQNTESLYLDIDTLKTLYLKSKISLEEAGTAKTEKDSQESIKDLLIFIKRVQVNHDKQQSNRLQDEQELQENLGKTTSENQTMSSSNQAREEQKSDSQSSKQIQESKRFVYLDLFEGVIQRIMRCKTATKDYADLLSQILLAFVELFSTELSLKTETAGWLACAVSPIFDHKSKFHQNTFQVPLQDRTKSTKTDIEKSKENRSEIEEKKENETQSTEGSKDTTKDETQSIQTSTKTDQFDPAQFEWRQQISKGDFLDCLKVDGTFSYEQWSKAEVIQVIGGSQVNLPSDGSQVRSFLVRYFKDISVQQKLFPADSPKIAPYNSKTDGDEWRMHLKKGDLVDGLNSVHQWQTGTVIEPVENIENPFPKIKLGYRQYTEVGEKSDEMGLYMGSSSQLDEVIPVYSVRIQKAFTMISGGGNEASNVCRKVQIPNNTSAARDSSSSTNNTFVDYTARQNQEDELDLLELESEGQIIYSNGVRPQCKSSLFSQILNNFGQQGGFENLQAYIESKETALDHVGPLIEVVSNPARIFHKSFADAYFERLASVVESKIIGSSESQLRQTKLQRIEQIIDRIWSSLMPRMYSDMDLKVQKSKLQVKVGLLFLRQTFLEKRIDGIKLVDQVCKSAMTLHTSHKVLSLKKQKDLEEKSSQQSEKPLDLVQELISVLQEHEIIRNLFSYQTIHTQLVQRSESLLKVFLSRKACSEEDLQLIWTNCLRDETTSLDLGVILKNIAANIPVEEANFFLEQIGRKDLSRLSGFDIELISNLGAGSGKREDPNVQENIKNSLKRLWALLFGESSKRVLDRQLAKKCIFAFIPLFRKAEEQIIIFYFEKIVQNLKNSSQGIICIKIVQRYLDEYLAPRADLSKDKFVDFVQEKYSFLDVLIGELAQYQQVVREKVSHILQANNSDLSSTKLKQLSKECFQGQFEHMEQLTERINFIKQFASQGKTQLTQTNLESLWMDLIELNPLDEAHTLIYDWIRGLADNFIIGRGQPCTDLESLTAFFMGKICGNSQVDFQKLSLSGYYCLQSLFVLVNMKAHKLILMDDDITRSKYKLVADKWDSMVLQSKRLDPENLDVQANIPPNEMVGIQTLWSIAIDCEEKKVGERVTNMLLQLHTNVDFGMDVTVFEDQFIKSCFEIMNKQRALINARSESEQLQIREKYAKIEAKSFNPQTLRRALPQAEKRLIACLSYLKMLILNSEKDGDNFLIPHVGLDQGKLLDNITIQNSYAGLNGQEFRRSFTIQCYSNETLFNLKRRVSHQLAFKSTKEGGWERVTAPHPWTIKLTKIQSAQTQLRDSDHGKTLAQLDFRSDEQVSALFKGTQSVSKMPLLNDKGDELNKRANHIFTGIFDKYAQKYAEYDNQALLGALELDLYVKDVTGSDNTEMGIAQLLEYDSNADGLLTLSDFLSFYKVSVTKKMDKVRENLSFMGYRDDLKVMPKPGSDDNVLQERKTLQAMPRYKIANDTQLFSAVLSLLSLHREVSKEAHGLLQNICTNQKAFWDILRLNEKLQEDDKDFCWSTIFNPEDINRTLYSLDIIDSILRPNVTNSESKEFQLRDTWIERFLRQGGFKVLMEQTQIALLLSRQLVSKNASQDSSKEQQSLMKKFINRLLKLLKIFIFIGVQADKDPEIAQEFLLLKKNSSLEPQPVDTDSKSKAKGEKNEQVQKDNFSQEPSKSLQKNQEDDGFGKQEKQPFNAAGPYSLYQGPYANVGTSSVIYGPQLPPSMKVDQYQQAGSDEQTNQNVQDQQHQESLNEKSFFSLAEFEKTDRFRQIVDQIRVAMLDDDLGGEKIQILPQIDWQDLQEVILEITALFLSNRSNSGKEEGDIIGNCLGLWSAALVQNQGLIEDFFRWKRVAETASESDTEGGNEYEIGGANEFILAGIYSTKSLYVRYQFKENIELICEKVTDVSQFKGPEPFKRILALLTQNMPGNDNSKFPTHQCGEFFNLISGLVQMFQTRFNDEKEIKSEDNSQEKTKLTYNIKQINFDFQSLFENIVLRLINHESSEEKQQGKVDQIMLGLMNLATDLIDPFENQVEYEQLASFIDKYSLIHNFFFENLFYMPGATKSSNKNKCKTQKSRTQAFKLLYRLLKTLRPKEMTDFLENYLWRMIKDLPRPKQWRYQPAENQRSGNIAAGVTNLGNICYMISMLQQFFMVPQFRFQLLKAIDDSPEDLKEYKERKVDDNLLRQFQRLFGFMEMTDRTTVDPFDFCFAYKDLEGNPTNVGIQFDSQEFLTFFFDNMEQALRNTSQKYLMQDVFQGSNCTQMVCQKCGHTRNNFQTFYTLSLQIENKQNLAESLQKQLEGELISDYKCEGCQEKVDLQRKNLFGEMPNVLIVHLQRIVFDYNTFQNTKVNTLFEFPNSLNLKKYSLKENTTNDQLDKAKIASSNSSDPNSEEVHECQKLEHLFNLDDQEYEYRLVGVNIHRGVASSGHYWSLIHTQRGENEPDKNSDQWLDSLKQNWLKFDDSEVSDYNVQSLASDAFGGSLTGMSDHERDIYNTNKEAWGKNAYMLIYERRHKRFIREVVLEKEEVQESQQEQLAEQTQKSGGEKTELTKYIDYSKITKFVPEWISRMVEKDNVDFVIDRQVFSNQFFFLIKLALKHISSNLTMTQHRFGVDYQVYFKRMNQMSLRIGAKVMFDFLSHYHENACLTHITDAMSTLATFSEAHVSFLANEGPSVLVEFINEIFLNDQCTYFFKLMFTCTDSASRLYCGKVAANVINKAFRIYGILSQGENAEKNLANPKLQTLKEALDQFMNLVLTAIKSRECQKNWVRLQQFYQMIEDIGRGGRAQAEYLLNLPSNLIVDLCDIMLGQKSPRAKNESEKRVEMGGSVTKASFKPLVNLASFLIKCQHTQQITQNIGPDTFELKTFVKFQNERDLSDKVKKELEPSYIVSQEALEYFTSNEFLTMVIQDEYSCDEELYTDALIHLCYGNRQVSESIIRCILRSIDKVGEFSNVNGYLDVIDRLCQIQDFDSKLNQPLQRIRLEQIFGYPRLLNLESDELNTLPKVGLDKNHRVPGMVDVYQFCNDDPQGMALLQKLWNVRNTVNQFTVCYFEHLLDTMVAQEEIREHFSNLPSITYNYARYTDWILAHLQSLLNQKESSSGGAGTTDYNTTQSVVSKETLVTLISKFEIYQDFCNKKDGKINNEISGQGVGSTSNQLEENEENEDKKKQIKQDSKQKVDENLQDNSSKANVESHQIIKANETKIDPKTTLYSSTPQPYVILRCTEETYLREEDYDGVSLMNSMISGEFVQSKPTGFENTAIGSTFKKQVSPQKSTLKVQTCDGRLQSTTNQEGESRSAAAMLQELNQQKLGGADMSEFAQKQAKSMTTTNYENGTPLRIKNQGSKSWGSKSSSEQQSNSKLVVADGDEQWSNVRSIVDNDETQMVDQDDKDPGYEQDSEGGTQHSSQTGKTPHSLSHHHSEKQKEESKSDAKQADYEQQTDSCKCQKDVFEEWDGDKICKSVDLIYKFSVRNSTEKPVIYRVIFESNIEQDHDFFLPLNGIKGTLDSQETTVALLLPRLTPKENDVIFGEGQLEKIQVKLEWQVDEVVLQKQIQKAQKEAEKKQEVRFGAENEALSVNYPAGLVDTAGTSSAISADPGFMEMQQQSQSQQNDLMIPPDTDADMKHCGACTMLNPSWATECEICTTKF